MSSVEGIMSALGELYPGAKESQLRKLAKFQDSYNLTDSPKRKEKLLPKIKEAIGEIHRLRSTSTP